MKTTSPAYEWSSFSAHKPLLVNAQKLQTESPAGTPLVQVLEGRVSNWLHTEEEEANSASEMELHTRLTVLAT